MAKAVRASYKCTECGWTGHKWVGRCPECQAWSSVTESSVAASSAGLRTSTAGVAPGKPARPVKEIPLGEVERTSTGIEEFDRVLHEDRSFRRPFGARDVGGNGAGEFL